ncbi:MAG: hypothetical protein C6Y22_04060 [Hapalosiphonaceae cyanobacterium JJU2]|nr:MAG: hypothetical protein C6Y22_04060 [Hapalosiphonaceae cyanobacterium JJU2]
MNYETAISIAGGFLNIWDALPQHNFEVPQHNFEVPQHDFEVPQYDSEVLVHHIDFDKLARSPTF